MDDIKQALYAILGKKKLGKPEYQLLQDNKGIGRFRYQCTVNGIAYVGFGNSRTKKDAMTNAARDFGQYLVREGMITPSELPQLQLEPSYMAPQQVVPIQPIIAPPSSLPYQFEGQQADQNFTVDDQPSFSGAVYNEKRHHPMNLHDKYVEQKAEEISQSEAVDMTAEIHGGWTLENCKQALNEFCQKNRLPARNYKISKIGTDNASTTFVAENEIFLPQMNRTIFGRGQGSNQKVAKGSCALTLVRQLFHMGVIPAAAGVQAARGQKKTVDNLPIIKVHVDPGLTARIERFLIDSGVQPVEDGLDQANQENPQSLLTDQKLEEFPQSQQMAAIDPTIVWAPPCQNWNAWNASNIDTQPIAFWSMERISKDLMMHEKAKEIPESMVRTRHSLPVCNHREQIVRTITENPVVLIKGSTGCGKSTQICQYLLESHLLDGRGAHFNCYVTQPRRISAITLAERVAAERYEQLGESMGYSVRFEGVTPRPYGAVMFVTVGVLMRKLEMGLRGISHVIIDEIHERDINTDFLLIVIRDMVRAHPKLRVILMSATIDTTLFTDYFGKCPIIEIEQRVHPVQHFFLEDLITMLNYMPIPPQPEKKRKKKKSAIAEKTKDADDGEEEEGGENSMALTENLLICGANYQPEVKKALDRMREKEIPIELIERLLIDIDENGKQGAVLIFLPGWNMISMLWNRLMLHPMFSNTRHFIVLPLHSQLSAREQHRVFEPVNAEQRKIILSTNIAETSVTIDDVVYVIDSCRVREKMYTSRNNLTHFANVWASRTNLIQRRGRAGRVQEGYCFHMITRARYEALEEHRTPEMLRTPLHEITLTIKLLRLGSVGTFLEKAVQPPPVDAVIEAEVLLCEMNALDKTLELTDLGRILARLPIEPKLGKMLLLGTALGLGDLMLTAAAATSFNSPYVPRERTHTKLSHTHRSFSGNRHSDHIGLVNCNQQFERELDVNESATEYFCRNNSLSYPLLSMTREAKRQLFDVLTRNSGFPEAAFVPYAIDVHGPDPSIDLLLSMLVAAYYPNICYMRDRRRVFTLEQATALLSNMSVCVPFNRAEPTNFSSPLFMFTEKLRTSCISCKQCSMISPLQLLLFGCRKVEAIGPDKVLVDNMIPLEMPAKVAAQIVALRPCLEALIVRTCIHPEQLASQPQLDRILAELVRDISYEHGWLPTGEEGLEPVRRQQSHPPIHRYNATEQGAYSIAQRPDFALPSFNESIGALGFRKRQYGAPPQFIPGVPGQYGNQPVPLVPNPAGLEAIAAASGLAGMAAEADNTRMMAQQLPFEQRDFSTMAGPSNYYGSGLPGSMVPQQRQLYQNGDPRFRGNFPRHGPRGRRGKRRPI